MNRLPQGAAVSLSEVGVTEYRRALTSQALAVPRGLGLDEASRVNAAEARLHGCSRWE